MQLFITDALQVPRAFGEMSLWELSEYIAMAP